MRLAIILLPIIALAAFPTLARPPYSGRYGSAHGFATGHCKTDTCFRKHPGGSYVFPLTGGERTPH